MFPSSSSSNSSQAIRRKPMNQPHDRTRTNDDGTGDDVFALLAASLQRLQTSVYVVAPSAAPSPTPTPAAITPTPIQKRKQQQKQQQAAQTKSHHTLSTAAASSCSSSSASTSSSCALQSSLQESESESERKWTSQKRRTSTSRSRSRSTNEKEEILMRIVLLLLERLRNLENKDHHDFNHHINQISSSPNAKMIELLLHQLQHQSLNAHPSQRQPQSPQAHVAQNRPTTITPTTAAVDKDVYPVRMEVIQYDAQPYAHAHAHAQQQLSAAETALRESLEGRSTRKSDPATQKPHEHQHHQNHHQERNSTARRAYNAPDKSTVHSNEHDYEHVHDEYAYAYDEDAQQSSRHQPHHPYPQQHPQHPQELSDRRRLHQSPQQPLRRNGGGGAGVVVQQRNHDTQSDTRSMDDEHPTSMIQRDDDHDDGEELDDYRFRESNATATAATTTSTTNAAVAHTQQDPLCSVLLSEIQELRSLVLSSQSKQKQQHHQEEETSTVSLKNNNNLMIQTLQSQLRQAQTELHIQDEGLIRAQHEIATLNDVTDAYADEILRLQAKCADLEEITSLQQLDHDHADDDNEAAATASATEIDDYDYRRSNDASLDSAATGATSTATRTLDDSSSLLDEALALAESLTDLIQGSGEDGDVMALLLNVSTLMDKHDQRHSSCECEPLACTSTSSPSLVNRSDHSTRTSTSAVVHQESPPPPDPVVTPETLLSSSSPSLHVGPSLPMPVIVEKLYTRCQLLERERTHLLETTLQLLAAAKEANAVELEAAFATARRLAAEEQEQLQLQHCNGNSGTSCKLPSSPATDK